MKTISPALQKNNRPMPLTPLLTLCGAIALMAGCASEPASHLVSAPPPSAPTTAYATTPGPTTTTQTTQTTPTGTVVTTQSQPSTIVVTQAPPALQTEATLAQPSSAHVWIPGYWTWRSNQYQWMAGRWEMPPYAGAKWMTPRWQTESGAYRFYEGYWN